MMEGGYGTGLGYRFFGHWNNEFESPMLAYVGTIRRILGIYHYTMNQLEKRNKLVSYMYTCRHADMPTYDIYLGQLIRSIYDFRALGSLNTFT